MPCCPVHYFMILITDSTSAGVLASLATLIQSRKSFRFSLFITCFAISSEISEIPSSFSRWTAIFINYSSVYCGISKTINLDSRGLSRSFILFEVANTLMFCSCISGTCLFCLWYDTCFHKVKQWLLCIITHSL